MGEGLPLLRVVADTLDSLGIALCVFDDADHTLLWNRSFLKFFPEHAGQVHAGDPYRANLRRFYQGRLAPDELPKIDQYIDSGVERHRNQQRPYAFEHRGVRLWVASLPVPGEVGMQHSRACSRRFLISLGGITSSSSRYSGFS